MNRHAVGRGVNHLLRNHQGIGGKIGRDGIRRQIADRAPQLNRRARGTFRIGMQEGDSSAREDRLPFEFLPAGNRLRRTAGGGDAPDVTAVDVVLVRGEDQLAAILGEEHVLDLERAGRQ